MELIYPHRCAVSAISKQATDVDGVRFDKNVTCKGYVLGFEMGTIDNLDGEYAILVNRLISVYTTFMNKRKEDINGTSVYD